MENQIAIYPKERIKQKILNDLKLKGYGDCKIDYQLAGGEGENFVSSVYRVEIQTKHNAKVKGFLKICHVYKKYIADILPIGKLFDNERLAYFDIFPSFENIQEKFVVTDKLKFGDCLSFSTAHEEEYLLLEDLSFEGYKTRSRDVKLDDIHMKLILEKLAHFHCLSFVLKKLEPIKYEKLTENLKEELLNMKDDLLPEMRLQAKYMTSIIEKEEIKNKMNGYLDLMESSGFFKDLLDGNVAKPYNVIGHGDFWNSNVMFRYEHGKPEDAIFVDFQFIRNHSPVLDLMHLLFTSCGDDLRTRNDGLGYLLDYYHQCFCDSAAQYNENGEELFPRLILFEHLKKFAPLGLLICIIMLPSHCREVGDAAEDFYDDASKSLEMSNNSKKYLDSSYNFVLDMCDKHGMLDFVG